MSAAAGSLGAGARSVGREPVRVLAWLSTGLAGQEAEHMNAEEFVHAIFGRMKF